MRQWISSVKTKKKKMFVKLWSMRFMQIFDGNQCKWVTEGQMVSNGGQAIKQMTCSLECDLHSMSRLRPDLCIEGKSCDQLSTTIEYVRSTEKAQCRFLNEPDLYNLGGIHARIWSIAGALPQPRNRRDRSSIDPRWEFEWRQHHPKLPQQESHYIPQHGILHQPK